MRPPGPRGGYMRRREFLGIASGADEPAMFKDSRNSMTRRECNEFASSAVEEWRSADQKRTSQAGAIHT